MTSAPALFDGGSYLADDAVLDEQIRRCQLAILVVHAQDLTVGD